MAWFSRKKKEHRQRIEPSISNLSPMVLYEEQRAHLFSGDSDITLDGWETASNSVDFFLRSELSKSIARARKCSRQDPLGVRFVELLHNNLIGYSGFTFKPVVKFGRKQELDKAANKALVDSWSEFTEGQFFDAEGRKGLTAFLEGIVTSCATDGAFLVEVITGAKVNKFGITFKLYDINLIDFTKNEKTAKGEIRMGVEYDSNGRRIKYHFKERDFTGNYNSGRAFTKSASVMIHEFMGGAANQTHGLPWMHGGLEKAKHFNKFDEAAMVRARATANRITALSNKDGDKYQGEEQGGESDPFDYDISRSGEVWDIGNRDLQQLDSKYPHEMYSEFTDRQIQIIAVAWGVSYAALSGDLTKASHNNGRTGTLEERETYMRRQKFLIERFLMPAASAWFKMAYLKGAITINGNPLSRPMNEYMKWSFEGRRWAWVDPKNDMVAAEKAVDKQLKSRRKIMEDMGMDADQMFEEIQEEERLFGQPDIKKTDENDEDD